MNSPPGKHESGLQDAVSMKMPPMHILLPESVYPSLQVGSHAVPAASELVQGDAAPFVIGADASQGGQVSRCAHRPVDNEQSAQHCAPSKVGSAAAESQQWPPLHSPAVQ